MRVVVDRQADWISNHSPPWAAYCALIACRLVALDKQPRVRPVGIGETLCRALAKLVMRASRGWEKTTCGNIQLCAGLEAGIEGATDTMGQRRLARVRERQEEAAKAEEVEEEEEQSEGIEARLNNLNIETVEIEE